MIIYVSKTLITEKSLLRSTHNLKLICLSIHVERGWQQRMGKDQGPCKEKLPETHNTFVSEVAFKQQQKSLTE